MAKGMRYGRRLPDGFYIADWYWDIGSGGTDLDERSRTGLARQLDTINAIANG